jgi:osmotically-inducible protein OsmY
VLFVTGQVDDKAVRLRVVQSVEAVPHVKRVVDRLDVLPTPAAAGDVRSHVATVLARAASAEAAYLEVDIEGHVAVLRGNVHSSFERRAAERASLAVPGISAVRNELTVNG